MNKRKEVLPFSNLISLLEEAVEATSQTKMIILENCVEIKTLLRGWCVPDRKDSLQEEEPLYVTPVIDTSEEIVKDINEALEYAQKVRKSKSAVSFTNGGSKLSVSSKSSLLSGNKAKLRPYVTNSGDSESSSGTSVRKEVLSRNLRSTSTKFLHPPGNKNPAVTAPKIALNKLGGGDAPSKSTPEIGGGLRNGYRSAVKCPSEYTKSIDGSVSKIGKSIKPKKSSQYQTTYQKDFALNSNGVKFHTVKQTNPCKTEVEMVKDNKNAEIRLEKVQNSLVVRPVSSVCYVSASGSISGKEINKLIDKQTVTLTLPMESTKRSNMRNTRPVDYQKPATPCVRRVCGSLQESLDLQGIPPVLLKPLRLYHQFLQDQGETKSCSSLNNFLDRLLRSNEAGWVQASYEPVIGLFTKYYTLFGEVKKNGGNENLREVFAYMEMAIQRVLNVHKTGEPDAQAVDSDPDLTAADSAVSNWRACGVWNSRAKKLIYDLMLPAEICAHYRGGHQLRKFGSNLQKLQRLQLKLEVLNLLRMELLQHKDLKDVSFYKTCSALSDLEFLIIPTVVKME